MPPIHNIHWSRPKPDSDGREAVVAANAELRKAAEAGAAVLFVLDGATIGPDAVAILEGALGNDPHFGFAFPRLYHPQDDRAVAKLHPATGDPLLRFVPRDVLQHVPEVYLPSVYLGPIILIRHEVIANLGALDADWGDLPAALLDLITRARRIGFRCVVANRALARAPDPYSVALPRPDRASFRPWMERYDDWLKTAEWFFDSTEPAYESALGRRLHAAVDVREGVLLDASGLTARLDGTTESILKLLDGVDRLDASPAVTVLVHPEVERYHGMAERYPRLEFLSLPSPRRFSVGVRLSQPWTFAHLRVLHRLALYNLVLMHDTIAWDTVYPVQGRVDVLWDVFARTTDGLLYNSAYTGDRFRHRFGAPPRERVLRFPLHPDVYRHPSAEGPTEPYVFVVGNRFDHKGLAPTLQLLSSSFPELRVRCLGYLGPPIANVDALPSGELADEQVEALYARATAIVFPSYYEGFGFPVARGLAYGRTVLARRSDLLSELAAHYRGPGRLIAFDTPGGLVAALRAVLAGDAPPDVVCGTALGDGEEPGTWLDVARNLMDFARTTVEAGGPDRWCERDRLFRAFAAYHAEQTTERRT